MRSPLLVAVLTAGLLQALPLAAFAADCSKTSVGQSALPDLGSGSYKGELGGLYPGGTNEPPALYAGSSRAAALAVVPLDAAGRQSATGKIVLLSIGMSNTTQEFSVFVSMTKADPARASSVVAVDGAQGGQDARAWAKPDARTWTVVEERLRAAGVTAAQVQAIWLKQAVAGPRADFASTRHELTGLLASIVENASARYPNLGQVFASPRTYAGYATTQLNPEPYAYESAFAVRDLIARSIADPSSRPWIGWGPYLWTDGTKGRSDGFTWSCEDTAPDGTHPSMSGRQKVAELLLTFVGTSPFTGWYRGGAPATTPSPTHAAAIEPEPADSDPVEGAERESERWPWVAGAIAVLLLGGAGFLLTRRNA